MRHEPQLATLRPPHAGSAPAAQLLGTACLAAVALALLRSRPLVPAPAGRAATQRSRRPNSSPVVPAQAGTHAERATTWPPAVPHRMHVVPAHAGTHAEHPVPQPGHAERATRWPPAVPHRMHVVPAHAGTHAEHPVPQPETIAASARTLHHAAALLALSVLLDSAIEHYRGQFENPGMFAPLAASLATTWAASRAGQPRASTTIYATALATGLAGSAFHAYNLARRPGGFSWQNLFYAAPLGAPAALVLAGAYGLAANKVAAGDARLLGLSPGRALSGLTAIGIGGTVAEAGMLHFRGAYHRPAMWLPVTLPPLSAAFLLRAAAGARDRLASACLGLTALLGIAGVAFHASGIARQMGGWRNWRQNLLSGPPLPAPPSFLALALAGRAALRLESRGRP